MLRLDALEEIEAAHAGGQPMSIPVDLIDEDPVQPRTEFDADALRELAATIQQRGVRQPISVRRHPNDSGRWMLNFGARRLRASRLAGKKDVPAFLDETADSYDQIIENEQRERLTPLELALFVQRRQALGESQREIARLLGKTQPYIAYVGALIDAPDWLMEAYRAGKCRGALKLYHLRRLHARGPSRVEAWLSERESVSRADVRQLTDEMTTSDPCTTDGAPASAAMTTKGQTTRAASSARQSTATASTARGSKPAKRLCAEHAGRIVELMLDRVPDDESSIFVRATRRSTPVIVAVDSLRLLGFRVLGT